MPHAAPQSKPACRRAPLIFIAAVSLAIWLALTLLLTKGAFPTPYLDEFHFWRLYADAKAGVLDISDVFALHNRTHLYALLKLWFWGVVHWDIDWRASMHVQVFFIALMAYMVLKYGMGARPTLFSMLMGLTAALALASARQHGNLYWAMQVSAAAMLLASMLSFYYVERLHETQKTKHAALAIFFAAVALLSSGGGIVTFAISIAAVFLASAHWRLKLASLSIGAAALGAWLRAMWPFSFTLEYGVGGVSAHNVLPSLQTLAIYFPQFFSNALYSASPRADDAASLATGCGVLAFSAYTLYARPRSKAGLFPRLLIWYALASCAAVACARLHLADPATSRYYPFAAALLAGNALALRQPENRLQKTAALLLAALTATAFFTSYAAQLKAAPHNKQWARSAHVHLCSAAPPSGHPTLAWMPDGYTNLDEMRRIFCREKDRR